MTTRVIRTFETYVESGDVEIDESDKAEIVEIDGPVDGPEEFVKIQSYSEERQHPLIDALVGKTVRVTIEIID